MPYKDKEIRREKNKEYQKKHYQNNKQYYLDKARDRQIKLREDFKDLKSSLNCSCGESHIACLDFHHLDPSKKDIAVGKAVNSGWSIKKIQKEIDKCIVLCSNCHRKIHYNEKYCE